MKQQQLRQLHDMQRGTLTGAERRQVRHSERKQAAAKGGFSTRCVHGDAGVMDETDHAPAIHVATAFALPPGEETPYIYARAKAPTRDRLETAFGLVEGGRCLAYASGMAAITSVLGGLGTDALVLLVNVGYTGTKSFFGASPLARTTDVEEFAKRQTSGRKVIFCELVRNPDSCLADIESLARLAAETKSLLVVDATFATPVLCRPLAIGAHVVIHSASKFIGGHSDVLAGLVVTTDVCLYLTLNKTRMWTGAIPGNLECFLLLRSLKTLQLRVMHSSRSAYEIAKHLKRHAAIESVSNGAMDQKQLWKAMAAVDDDKLACPCFTFALKSEALVARFMERLRLFEMCTSLGGAASSIDHRSRWDSSRSVCEFRLSVGLEDVADLISDLDNALAEE